MRPAAAALTLPCTLYLDVPRRNLLRRAFPLESRTPAPSGRHKAGRALESVRIFDSNPRRHAQPACLWPLPGARGLREQAPRNWARFFFFLRPTVVGTKRRVQALPRALRMEAPKPQGRIPLWAAQAEPIRHI